MPVRQAEEHHVVTGERVGVGGLQHAVCQRQQMRMMLGQRRAGAGGGGQRADRQPAVGICGMSEQQPQDLSAGITAGTGHRDG